MNTTMDAKCQSLYNGATNVYVLESRIFSEASNFQVYAKTLPGLIYMVDFSFNFPNDKVHGRPQHFP